MTPIKKKSVTRATVVVALVLILPITSMVLSYLFHNDIVMDKPRVVEELIKSVVSLLISLTALVVSDTLRRREIDRKVTALRHQIRLQLLALSDSCRDMGTITVLDRLLLQNSPAEVIRSNSKNEQEFKVLAQNLYAELEEIHQVIITADSEVGICCSDYSNVVSQCIIAIRDYSSQPSPAGIERVKLKVSGLLALTNETHSNPA
jgi:hypothetical protein